MNVLLILFSFSTSEAKPNLVFWRKGQTPKPIEIDFGEFEVNADASQPNLKMVEEVKRAHFNPMMKLRMDFNPELEQSVSMMR